jgi:hypothetical protein
MPPFARPERSTVNAGLRTMCRQEGSTVKPSDDIAAFLMSRRARITPEQAGLPSFGSRRVAGLRREEVASSTRSTRRQSSPTPTVTWSPPTSSAAPCMRRCLRVASSPPMAPASSSWMRPRMGAACRRARREPPLSSRTHSASQEPAGLDRRALDPKRRLSHPVGCIQRALSSHRHQTRAASRRR